MNALAELPPPPEDLKPSLYSLRDFYKNLADQYRRLSEEAHQKRQEVERLLQVWDAPLSQPSFFLPPVEREAQSLNTSPSPAIDPSTITTEDILWIMEQHKGKCLHVDFIVRELFGILEYPRLTVLTTKIKNLLVDGKRFGLWDKVPQATYCYTLDLSLVEPEDTATDETTVDESSDSIANSNDPSYQYQPHLMKKEYQGKSVVLAIEDFLRQNEGKKFTIAEIMENMWKTIPTEYYRFIRETVRSSLSTGKRSKKWDKVPGTVGCYTYKLATLRSR